MSNERAPFVSPFSLAVCMSVMISGPIFKFNQYFAALDIEFAKFGADGAQMPRGAEGGTPYRFTTIQDVNDLKAVFESALLECPARITIVENQEVTGADKKRMRKTMRPKGKGTKWTRRTPMRPRTPRTSRTPMRSMNTSSNSSPSRAIKQCRRFSVVSRAIDPFM